MKESEKEKGQKEKGKVKGQKEKVGKEAGIPRQTLALVLLGMGAVAFVLIFLLTGLFSPVPSAPAVPSYMEQVPGEDHGTVVLIGRTGCPWCQKTRDLLANMSVGYYWVDLATLDQTQTQKVVAEAATVCSSTDSVPMLIVNGQCIVGYNETAIRGALG